MGTPPDRKMSEGALSERGISVSDGVGDEEYGTDSDEGDADSAADQALGTRPERPVLTTRCASHLDICLEMINGVALRGVRSGWAVRREGVLLVSVFFFLLALGAPQSRSTAALLRSCLPASSLVNRRW